MSKHDFMFTFSPQELKSGGKGGELKRSVGEGEKIMSKRKKVEARVMDLISEEKEGEEENQ